MREHILAGNRKLSVFLGMGLALLLAACGAESERGEMTSLSQAESTQPAAQDTSASVAATQVVESSSEPLNLEAAAPTAVATRIPEDAYEGYEIVTLLPRDAIPAIDNPQFLVAAEADDSYDPDELVIGVVFDGDARAYSVPLLSRHEIVNDTVGGVKIAVTW